jgi:putative SOS response-associated peptidase YedK
MMAPLHHRMPLMFNDPKAWLEGNSFEGHLDDLSWHAVGRTVNNTRNQGIELIQFEK